MSKCGFCDNKSFEIEDNSPKNSSFRYTFIQCDACKAVVGVVEAVNPIAVMNQIKVQLNNIKELVTNLGAVR